MRSRQKASEKFVFNDPFGNLGAEYEKTQHSQLFESLNSAEDGILQINILKEFQKVMSLKPPEQLSTCKSDINVLCFMFLQSPSKSSLKKTLNRILQDLSHKNQEVICNCLQYSLQCTLDACFKNTSVKDIDRSIECFLGMLDNFPIGVTVIRSMVEVVWKYFSHTLTYILKELKVSNSTELYSACQSLLKAFTLILQNSEGKTTTEESLCNDLPPYYDEIVTALESLLVEENTPLNCRLNAGIAFSYFYYHHDPFTFKKQIYTKASHLSISPKLCVFSGIMAVLPAHKLVATPNDIEILKVFIIQILNIFPGVGDTDLLLLSARVLIQWSNIMCTVLCGKCKEPLQESQLNEVKKLFNPKYHPLMTLMFEYVLQNREHYVDTLRHLTKDLFKNILNLHILSVQLDLNSLSSPELKAMALHLLNDLPPHSQGKYGLLGCIVDVVGTDCTLDWYPLLPDALYEASKDVNLITHVADLLETLFRKSVPVEIDEKFINVWLKPLLRHLCSESKEQTTAMNEHVLPKLFKVKPSILKYLLSELSSIWEKNQGNCFSALINCVKYCLRQDPNKSALDFISFTSLVNAMSHADDQVRISAFSLICENTKTTEPVPMEAFDLIKETLRHNICCQAPAFRQQLVSCLKKLFNRMDKSKQFLENKKQTNESGVSLYQMQQEFECRHSIALEGHSTVKHWSYYEIYENFLTWIKNFLYDSLCPGANFPRRVTALNLLSLLHSIFSGYFNFVSNSNEVQTLLYALQDTYENNKIAALQLLSATEISFLESQLSPCTKALLQTTLTLASSSKPTDTVTAAYMSALISHYSFFKPVFRDRIAQQVREGFCSKIALDHRMDGSSTEMNAIVMLIGELLLQLKVAQLSLLDAAAHAPLYGVLSCIRSVVSQVDFRIVKVSDSSHNWSCLIEELLALSVNVATTVEPVVCNSSPEGHLPMDTDTKNIQQLQTAVRRAIGSRFQSAVVESDAPSSNENETVVLDIVKTRAVTAQVLLLCCWRTHKEVSLLFGEIVEKIPVCEVDGVGGDSLLTVTQVMDIGQYFIRQMTLVKHKGAFEQAFIGFSKLCHMLWRSNIKALPELPKVWLSDLLLAIRGLKDNTHLCSTRRSAGLPFIVQALLTSEPALNSSSFFKSTISSLLSMASVESNDNKEEEKIHALNILRALFRDSCLSDVLVPFVAEGVVVSITGFKSKTWAVRNSSTLLFSALMTRIFGVIRPQDETGKKNRLTGKTFFSYYEINDFLYNELKECSAFLCGNKTSTCLVPTLYPVLLLLSRLYPAPGEKDPLLASFVKKLQLCRNIPVRKMRVLIAKALVNLTPTEDVEMMLTSLFKSLIAKDAIQNRVHGRCLQVLNILREVPNLPHDIEKSIKKCLPSWIQDSFYIALNSNKCYTTKAAYLEIVLCSMTMNTILDPNLAIQLISETLPELNAPQSGPDKEQYLSTAITVALLSLSQMPQDESHKLLQQVDEKYNNLTSLIEEFLLSPYESARCTVLFVLVCLFRDISNEIDLESSVYPVFFSGLFNASVCGVIERCKGVGERLKNDEILNVFVPSLLTKKDVCDSSSLGVIYQLLSLMPLTIEYPWDFILTTEDLCECQKLNYVLSQLLKSKDRFDVFNEILLYSTHLILNFCGHVESKKKCSHFYHIMQSWTMLMTESSKPEACISRRKRAVSVFRLIFSPAEVGKLKVFGNLSAELWQGLVCLLIDDEPEIKQQSSEIVMSLWASKTPSERSLPIVSWLALDHLLQLFVKEGTCSPDVYIEVFLNLMLSCERSDEENGGDEEPFDRGELNVFAEDLTLTSHVAEHFSKYISAQQIDAKSFFDIEIQYKSTVDRKQNSHCSDMKYTNKDTFTIKQVLQLCLEEAKSLADVLVNLCQNTPILDSKCDRDLIALGQRCSVIGVLSPYFELKSEISDLARKVKDIKCRTYFLDGVLRSLLQAQNLQEIIKSFR